MTVSVVCPLLPGGGVDHSGHYRVPATLWEIGVHQPSGLLSEVIFFFKKTMLHCKLGKADLLKDDLGQ